MKGLITKITDVKANELPALLFAAAYFYLLLCAYYIIRPIRNEMVIQNGVANIQWLLLAAAVIMLAITPIFGWITNRYRVREFLSVCTLFFASNLVVFFFLFRQSEITESVWVSRGFYVWVNVFNMFIVSLFWSMMNDVFNRDQAKRLFASIAAGGTAGALTGPIITTLLVEKIGLSFLLLIAAVVLSLTVICIQYLARWRANRVVNEKVTLVTDHHESNNELLKGGLLDGVRLTWQSKYLRMIACFSILLAILSTFLSIQLAEIIESTISDSTQRTKLFSLADLATNVLTLLFQLSITSRLIKWIGYRNSLMLVPVGLTIGFVLMGFMPVLSMMVGLSIFNRAGKYAVLNPTSEMLFSVVSREEKYKAKNFIDTAVVRSSNVLSSWIYSGVKALGASAFAVAILGAMIGVIWSLVAYWLGNKQIIKKSNV